MSTAAQSVGYLIGTMGPFGLGLAHSLSGGWTLPLILLVAVAAAQVVLAWLLTSTKRDGASRDRGGRNTGATTLVPLSEGGPA